MNTENHKYSKFEVDRVKALDIRQFIPGCNIHKVSQDVECPFCGKMKFNVSRKKGSILPSAGHVAKGSPAPLPPWLIIPV